MGFYTQALITLDCDDKTLLFILLDQKGVIHRKGDGSSKGLTLPLVQGYSSLNYFEAFLTSVPRSIFDHPGVYKQQPYAGKIHTLSIVFVDANGNDLALRAVYGDESQGPPSEMVQTLINAVKITETWYQNELNPPIEGSTKPWWKFW